GRIDRVGVAGAVALSVAASAVLLGCHAVLHPDVSPLAAHLPALVFRHTLLAAIVFSTANAVLEELLCRWVLYDAVEAEWGGAMAVAATSVFFGLGHWNGYPPGWMGAFLAGAYGVGLALLRRWSGGLALSMACHIGADATIFWILVSSGALAGP
ncbi:MAG TPA: CPBP family intramembrane glutamic endopeptidase, partial [Gemmataceae bacterium]|nr:CPBP family intramembrane glutamic endopeptidase [Gemmataceae bacterium]